MRPFCSRRKQGRALQYRRAEYLDSSPGEGSNARSQAQALQPRQYRRRRLSRQQQTCHGLAPRSIAPSPLVATGLRRPSRPNDIRKFCVEGALGDLPPSRRPPVLHLLERQPDQPVRPVREEERDGEHVALELQVLGREPHAEPDAVGEQSLQLIERTERIKPAAVAVLFVLFAIFELFPFGPHLDGKNLVLTLNEEDRRAQRRSFRPIPRRHFELRGEALQHEGLRQGPVQFDQRPIPVRLDRSLVRTPFRPRRRRT